MDKNKSKCYLETFIQRILLIGDDRLCLSCLGF